MKIIALDSSGLVASAAILNDDIVIAEYSVNFKRTHSETLLPMLDEIMRMTEQDISEADAVAVAAGPGSFTGLRIGSATAKGLGLALDIPVIAVPTTEGLAYNLWGAAGLICPLMDARRHQTYTGIYAFDADGAICELREACAVDVNEIFSDLNERKEPVTFLGDGVPVFFQDIKSKVNAKWRIAPQHQNRQRAASVGVAAFYRAMEGKTGSADMHRPEYLRLSQAERERMEAERAKASAEGRAERECAGTVEAEQAHTKTNSGEKDRAGADPAEIQR
ncbi:MAG: tRNA (adenosine(37)-N6)-threonylcarbamoyltransferase complex dimerization subunit type 1 TsaB [Lachnospiraceae bacterium]|nr:tRNA (adenosine(37)-N6)-threonylcarbamoyltransferase complex dimerization subunit type 1 TsaB [Lachnospiraceae bacterium]